MTLTPEQQELFSKIYGDSMRDALANLDKVAEETRQLQAKALDEIQETQEARKALEHAGEKIAYEVLSKQEKEMKAEIRRVIEIDHITALLMAGRTFDEISEWLDMGKSYVQKIWSSLSPGRTPGEGVVRISQSGRGGTVQYQRGDVIINFYWEFGGGDTVAIIDVPNPAQWEAQTKTPVSDRMTILDRVGVEVIRQQAPSCKYRVLDQWIEIV